MKIKGYLIGWVFFSCCFSSLAGQLLTPIQYFNTTGARELTPFTLNEEHFIAAAQLAEDIPNSLASMNGGNADVDVVIFKRKNEEYSEYQRIPGHGNEGATFFTIDNNSFLAIPSVSSGPHPPFNHNTYTMLYRWDGRYFYPVQQFYTHMAKQAYYFNFGKRHFLALANGGDSVNSENNNSMIYEWNGKQFLPFQAISSFSAYSFYSFMINHTFYLALADGKNFSTLYRWNGKKFINHQQFKGEGGRAFTFFTINNKQYLGYANIKSDSIIYEWDGHVFQESQRLEGEGGRNLTYFTLDNEHYLMRVNFITGSKTNPETALKSPLYQLKNGKWTVIQNIPTFGGVSAHIYTMDGLLYLTLANSLSKQVRFKVPSVLYQVTHGQTIEFG